MKSRIFRHPSYGWLYRVAGGWAYNRELCLLCLELDRLNP